MKITINYKEFGNYNTKLYNLLNNLDTGIFFNDEHDLRSPLSIYSMAFSKILSSCNEVINTLEKKEINIKEKYIVFLNAVNAFIDDGYNILKCFYSSSRVNKKIAFADKWLEKIDVNSIKKYKESINLYTKDTKYIVNKIKHEHGRISEIMLKTNIASCMGFFLEKYHDGVLQPDEEVHKKYNNQRTCFSYQLDIMKNLVAVYYISEEIAKYIEKNIIQKEIIYNKLESKEDEKIKLIIHKIWNLSKILFCDQYFRDFDIIDLDEANEELIIRSPAPQKYKRKFIQYNNCTITFFGNGDGTSKSFALPYMGENK